MAARLGSGLQAACQLVSGWCSCSCARAIASTNLRAGAIGCRRPSQAFRVRVGCPCPTVCHSGPGPASVTVKDSGHHASEFEGTKGAHLARRIGAFQNTTGVLPGDRFGPSSCKQRGRARARTFGACRGANDRAALAVARALAAGGLCCPQGPAHDKASVPQPASCLHGQPHTRPR